MFDAPLDTLYVWLGLSIVSLTATGTVLAFPTASPVVAGPAADAVDAVAASEYEARESVEIPAGAYRLGPHSLAVRTDGTTAHQSIEYGPVTPVREEKLRSVLAGTPPEDVFVDSDAFRAAVEAAQRRDDRWRNTPARLTVRRITWGEVNATLVG